MPEINDSVRKQIAARANHSCEYCLIHEDGLITYEADTREALELSFHDAVDNYLEL